MPRKCDTQKSLRVMQIISILDDGKPRKTSELASRFAVSSRSIQRDFASIELIGYSLVFPRKGYVQFAEGVSLKKRPITAKQQQGLNLFKAFSKNLPPDIAEACFSLVRSFEESRRGAGIIPVMPKVNFKKGSDYIDEISEAVDLGHAVKISYLYSDGKEKEQEIRPLALLYSEGFVYVFSSLWENPSQKRTYRLDRIRKIEHLYEKTFSPPQNIDSMIKAHNIWGVSGGGRIEIKLEIRDWAKDYFKNFILFRKQQVKERDDGVLELKAEISKFEEVLPQILRWIPCVKVISPQSLIQETRKIVEEYLKKSH